MKVILSCMHMMAIAREPCEFWNGINKRKAALQVGLFDQLVSARIVCPTSGPIKSSMLMPSPRAWPLVIPTTMSCRRGLGFFFFWCWGLGRFFFGVQLCYNSMLCSGENLGCLICFSF